VKHGKVTIASFTNIGKYWFIGRPGFRYSIASTYKAAESMRKSKTLKRVRNNQVARIALLGHYIPAYVFHAARAGHDCIWLDLEHREMSTKEVQSLLAYAHLFDIDFMIRPPTKEKTPLCRYLEDGAAGLMIPQVANAEQAQELVMAAKFPPIGDRGIDNAGLDSDFCSHDPDEYVAWANRETFLVLQIETPEAVQNIDSIVQVEGVDGIFVGPADLGLRLRQSGEISLEKSFEIVIAACAKYDKPWGCPAYDTNEFEKRSAQGARLLPSAKAINMATVGR
jgi:2-keto-3-deoxy-L-rhamnonate aldolase RhmA